MQRLRATLQFSPQVAPNLLGQLGTRLGAVSVCRFTELLDVGPRLRTHRFVSLSIEARQTTSATTP